MQNTTVKALLKEYEEYLKRFSPSKLNQEIPKEAIVKIEGEEEEYFIETMYFVDFLN